LPALTLTPHDFKERLDVVVDRSNDEKAFLLGKARVEVLG
jgi:hypothetical protein